MNRMDADTLEFLTREIERAYADYMSYVPSAECLNSLDIYKAGALRFHKLLDDEFIKLKSESTRRKEMAKAPAKKATTKAKKTPAKAVKKSTTAKKASSTKASVTKKRGRPFGSKNKAVPARKAKSTKA